MTADPWAARLPCDVSDSQGVYKGLHTPVPHEATCSGAAQQPVCPSGCQSVCQSPSTACLLQNVSAPLTRDGCSPAWLVPLQRSETPSRAEQRSVQTYTWTPRKLLLLTAKPNLPMGLTPSTLRLCQTQRSPSSTKCFFLPCSEDLLAWSGGASGIIVGSVLSHWSRAIVCAG